MLRVQPPPTKFLRFAEKVNGRCAMQGVVWGGVNYAQTHASILQQMSDPKDALPVVAVAGAVTLGTAITAGILDLEVKEQPEDTIWTDDAEVLNSRLAMVSFPLLAIATSIA